MHYKTMVVLGLKHEKCTNLSKMVWRNLERFRLYMAVFNLPKLRATDPIRWATLQARDALGVLCSARGALLTAWGALLTAWGALLTDAVYPGVHF
jgi:hypothetical protein